MFTVRQQDVLGEFHVDLGVETGCRAGFSFSQLEGLGGWVHRVLSL